MSKNWTLARDCHKAKEENGHLRKGNGQKQFTQARVYSLTPGDAEIENDRCRTIRDRCSSIYQVGISVVFTKTISKCPIDIDGRSLLANLIIFVIHGFDIILGLDWLLSNHAIINYHHKEIIFRLPSEAEFKLIGTKVNFAPLIIFGSPM
jgi:hypothetical protein